MINHPHYRAPFRCVPGSEATSSDATSVITIRIRGIQPIVDIRSRREFSLHFTWRRHPRREIVCRDDQGKARSKELAHAQKTTQTNSCPPALAHRLGAFGDCHADADYSATRCCDGIRPAEGSGMPRTRRWPYRPRTAQRLFPRGTPPLGSPARNDSVGESVGLGPMAVRMMIPRCELRVRPRAATVREWSSPFIAEQRSLTVAARTASMSHKSPQFRPDIHQLEHGAQRHRFLNIYLVRYKVSSKSMGPMGWSGKRLANKGAFPTLGESGYVDLATSVLPD